MHSSTSSTSTIANTMHSTLVVVHQCQPSSNRIIFFILRIKPRPFPRTDTMGLTTSAYEGDEAKGSSQQSEQSANRSTEKEEERSDESSPEGSTVSDDSGNRHQPPSDVAEYPSTGGASVFDESHLAPRSQDLQEIYGQPEHFQVSLGSPVELEAMSANELKNHIKEVGPSRSDILTASRLLHQRQPFSSGGVSIGAVTPASPSLPQGFYVDDGHFANDVKLAMRILSASTEVRELRFKLVPAKLKEPIFWTALLEILRCSKACIGTADKFDPNLLFITSAHDYGAKTGLVPPESRPEQAPPCTPSSVSSSDDHQTEAVALRRQLQQRNFEVLHLRRALEKTKAKIQSMEKEMEKKARSDSRTNASCAGPALKVHKGKWQMNRDSREFFSLDEELKANLRAEKTKRLREVSEQMKFILDADDVYGHGQWDCCGRKEYGADGCA